MYGLFCVTSGTVFLKWLFSKSSYRLLIPCFAVIFQKKRLRKPYILRIFQWIICALAEILILSSSKKNDQSMFIFQINSLAVNWSVTIQKKSTLTLTLISILYTRPILESKGMHAIFQKKCKKRQKKYIFLKTKKGKIFKNLGKKVQNLIFWKRAGDCVW